MQPARPLAAACLLLASAAAARTATPPPHKCGVFKAKHCDPESCRLYSSVAATCCSCYRLCCSGHDGPGEPPEVADISRTPSRPSDGDGGDSGGPPAAVGCTDEAGAARGPLERWPDDAVYPCRWYSCRHGQPRLEIDLNATCPQPPADYACTRSRPAGHCCFDFNCTRHAEYGPGGAGNGADGAGAGGAGDDRVSHTGGNVRYRRPCVDASGVRRPHGSTWTTANGCHIHTCSDGQIHTAVVDCGPVPGPGCVPITTPGVCCPRFQCDGGSSCSHGGRTFPDGVQFPDDPDHPCATLICRNGTVQVLVPPPPCPPPTCADPQWPIGQCCRECLTGCVDAVGTTHPVNQLYVDNPSAPEVCYICTAGPPPTPLLVLNVTAQCPLPPVDCVAAGEQGRCCPRISCPQGDACIFEGTAYAPGAEWFDDPVRPCVRYRCDGGDTTAVSVTACEPVPRHCTAWYMDGVCCPRADCPGASCTHAGQEHDDGTTWPLDPARPCTLLTCRDGQVSSQDVSGACPPPPYDHCTEVAVHYQCCPAYDCVRAACLYDGDVYREGATWLDNATFPCKRFNCTKCGVVTLADYGADCPPQPYPHCTGHRTAGQCCKRWDCPGPRYTGCAHGYCSGCQVDGTVYREGQTWWDDSARRCVQYVCRRGTARLLHSLLPCPAVPADCRPDYSGTECCHYKYTCPSCMFDVYGNLIPMYRGKEA